MVAGKHLNLYCLYCQPISRLGLGLGLEFKVRIRVRLRVSVRVRARVRARVGVRVRWHASPACAVYIMTRRWGPG